MIAAEIEAQAEAAWVGDRQLTLDLEAPCVCLWCASGSFRVAGWARDLGNWLLSRQFVRQMGRNWR